MPTSDLEPSSEASPASAPSTAASPRVDGRTYADATSGAGTPQEVKEELSRLRRQALQPCSSSCVTRSLGCTMRARSCEATSTPSCVARAATAAVAPPNPTRSTRRRAACLPAATSAPTRSTSPSRVTTLTGPQPPWRGQVAGRWCPRGHGELSTYPGGYVDSPRVST